MKKGNRVLAMFLAAVMLVTSIAWDFGETKAGETTSAITPTDDGVSINFDNIDVAELDAAGYTSTRFKGTKVIAGEVNKKVSEHWFSGDGDDTPYGDVEASTIKAKNIGLKTDELHAGDSNTFMYTPYTYEDFQVSAEIYYGGYTGIVFGEKNAYPKVDGTASSVAVYFNGGNVHVVGAITRSTAKLMRGNSTANIANWENELGHKILNNGSKTDINGNPGTVRTLYVKKTGDHLIIWVSGCSGVMTIELSDLYKTGWIGIQSNYYDSDGGGLKSLDIQKVHATESHSLDNAVMSELDDMGYTATLGEYGVVGSDGKATTRISSVGNVFFSGTSGYVYNSTTTTLTSANEGLKGRATGTSIAGLNIPWQICNANGTW